VVEREGKRLIEIDIRRTEEGVDRLISTLLLDPERGYLVIEGVEFDEGRKVGEFRTEVKEIAPGVWCPSKGTSWSDLGEKWTTHMEVLEMKLLDPKSARFDLASLHPAEGARIGHVGKDGRVEPYVVRDGQSIPWEVDAQLRKQ
jgi:hypothetical protein